MEKIQYYHQKFLPSYILFHKFNYKKYKHIYKIQHDVQKHEHPKCSLFFDCFYKFLQAQTLTSYLGVSRDVIRKWQLVPISQLPNLVQLSNDVFLQAAV